MERVVVIDEVDERKVPFYSPAGATATPRL